MTISYYPKVGEILQCDFRGYEFPEMIKRRPVVVVVSRLEGRSRDLVTIVPLSAKDFRTELRFRLPIKLEKPLSPKFGATDVWAVCDMLAVVSRARLNRFRIPVAEGAKAHWVSHQLSREQVTKIKHAMLSSLGLSLDS